MGMFDKAKEAAEKAKQAAQDGAEKAKQAAHDGAEKAKEMLGDESIADAIISALARQEKINKILEEKGSKYQIGEICVELGIPPSISFSITRK